MNEFIQQELTTAPVAEPSLGLQAFVSRKRGQSHVHMEETSEDKARREYEESNYTRLPHQSKKERKLNGKRQKKVVSGSIEAEFGDVSDRILGSI